MGNQPSSEAAYGESLFVHPPPSHADRPLPPLPPLSTHASRISHISHYSHASASSLPPSSYDSPSAASAQKLSKPRIRSTAGLLKSPDVVDEKGTGSGSRRFSTAGIAHLVAASFSSPNTPTTSSFAAAASSSFSSRRRRSSSRSRTLPPQPPSLLPPSPGARSPSVFTFEEAVVAVTGQQNPAAWRPPVTSIYPTPSLDIELLQEQQARQLEFELRQRENQLQFQKLQREAQKLQRDRERELRRYSSYEFGLYDQAITDTELDNEDNNEDELIERGRHQLRLLKQKQKQKERSRRRSSFFRSKSSQRPSLDLDQIDQLDDRDYRDFRDYTRRNSIGSVYRGAGDRTTWDIGSMTYDQVLGQYYGGPLSENWPPQAGSRTSWNYDMSSYAAKRLLHIVDDNPLDNRLEQGSIASESRYSLVSEVTWKSSHPVRPKSPTLTRANSDLSLYAPVRRTSIVQVPGVATRRNSTSSFTSAGGASMRPAFRHSHPATTPSLSRRTSFESTGSRVMSMPPPELQRPELSADSTVEAAARVSTPPDGEYNTIGTFKLGSLRITNGAESPMSSPETKRAREERAAKHESARSPTIAAEERTRALAALSTSTTVVTDTESSITITTSTVVAEANDANDGSRQISPLSPALYQPPVELFAGIVSKPVVFHELPVREPVVSPSELPQIELTQDLFADFEFSSFSFQDTVPVTVVEPPTVQPPPVPTTLQTTSKTTALEDLLFEEDDHSTSGYADPEILDVRVDPNAKASPSRGKAANLAARKSAHSMQSVSRSDSGFVSSPTSESSSRKALSKADSGYSSNVSLRSFKQAASKLINSGTKSANRLSAEKDAAANQGPERQSFVIDELQLPSPTINTPDMAFRSMSPATTMRIKRKPLPPSAAVARPPAPHRDAPLPPQPPVPQTMSPENMSRDVLPLSPVSMSMTDTSTPATSESSAAGTTAQTNKRHAVPSPLDNLRPAANSDSQPSPATSPIPLTPASVRSNGSVSAHSIGSGTQRPSKLLRFLSFANVSSPNVAPANKGPPAVHVTHIEGDSAADIPSVPSNVNDKLREHTGLFPMSTKRLALKTQMSRDTLKTIFSVGSLETRSSSDLRASAKDDLSRDYSSRAPHRRNTLQAPSSLASVAAAAVMPLKAVAKRKSRLSMAVDFTDEFEEDDLAQEAHEHQYISSNTFTPEPIPDNKEKKARRSWLRWGKDGERQTPSPENTSDDDDAACNPDEQGQDTNAYGDSGIGGSNQLHRTSSRSSSIISRTMSLTAQLERSLSLKITFPKISISRPSTSDRPTIPISAFSTAFKSSLPISPSLPSPLFAEAMEQQRRTMAPEVLAAASPPVSARMQQIRPSVLRVPPSLRPQSRPSSEGGGHRISRPSSQDSLYNAAAVQYYQTTNMAEANQFAGTIVASPPLLNSPQQSVQPDMDVPRQRRGSLDYSHMPHRSLSGNDTHMAFVAAGGKMFMPHGGGGSQDGQPRVIRHRASFNGYSSGPDQLLGGGNYAVPPPSQQPRRNPPRMSNGYTGSVTDPFGSGHRRSGSASSSRSDKYQIQQQQAWDFYYQQYARPPPNVARGSHHRNRSMGSRHGPVPGPQAPYRILHSYNSPAYRGVPIWG